MKEPVWMTTLIVEAVHFDQVREHGGLHGLSDEGLLESALSRPLHQWSYGEQKDLAALAAAYGFGIARNHPFRDGNKRTAFLTMVTFLGLNDFNFEAAEVEIVSKMLALAAGHLSETELAGWLGQCMSPRE